ncbi:glycine--tRNA ligase subunit beta [Maricaulis salignorans]|uniref:Glycine--tRNA ligase beta subunit n=1 Tax=Maricaulis salignorans TaxID=144026 RepID=A0A1G9RL98_9PROT|nr:glycine--tRNA ligase subunit beta [Maricaulis salignorans]SDM24003.1 glycyl-tRNA synthetase beta chain [Maricaulis salignorans]
MSELLFEIFCEEIPARMQARAEADLARLLGDRLKAAGLGWKTLTTFAGPRRLGLAITGLPLKTEDVREERKGPRTDAPEKAVQGFLRGAGLDSLDGCETRDDKKGQFWVAIIEKPGRATVDVVAEAIPAVMKEFPWPKSMKFGEGEKLQRWVRPVHRLLCLFDGAVVPFEVFGIVASNITEGHRRHGPGPFEIRDFAHYTQVLREQGHVVQQREAREAIILEGARKVCQDAGLELVEDAGLLHEVAGLAEWPVPLLGKMDPDFLDLPPEVITLTMKTHQKYFAVRKPGEEGLAAHFVVVANQAAPDGGKAIAAGNARVLSARLSDARHFWDNDRKTPLDEMVKELGKVTFHEKLGSVADKVERVAALARELAPIVGADPDLAEKAARLAKADLVSEMVYEFPELQGAMGRYYALDQWRAAQAPSGPSGATSPMNGGGQNGDAPRLPPLAGEVGRAGPGSKGGLDWATLCEADAYAVADACRDHYKPQGPTDDVPTAPVTIAVALADKLDTLVGFWAIDEKPTGSKDPFALRRAALGVIRILLGGKARMPLAPEIKQAVWELVRPNFDEPGKNWRFHDRCKHVPDGRELGEPIAAEGQMDSSSHRRMGRFQGGLMEGHQIFKEDWTAACLADRPSCDEIIADLLAFFADRLKVHLRDEGIRHDVLDAVFALGDDDLVRVTNKARALQAFLDTDDGAALLAGFNRAANILKSEEKKSGETFDGAPDAAYLAGAPEAPEQALIAALEAARPKADAALAAEDFTAAMAALALLRAPIDAFFETVTVNADEPALRRNRLLLLSDIRAAICAVADFNRIDG